MILAAVFLVAMLAMSLTFFKASASTKVTASSLFTTTGDAALNTEDADVLTYTMGGGENTSVSYRRTLALKWYDVADGSSAGSVTGEAQYLSLTIGFAELNFTEFKVAFEFSRLSMSKAGKTAGALLFTPDDAGGLNVSVEGASGSVNVAKANIGTIVIALGEAPDSAGTGEFTVSVNGNGVGAFTNIGKNYARYASASSETPLTPIRFSATTASEEDFVTFEIAALNGQSFALDENKQITDDTPPVLVIDSEIKRFVLGTKFAFDMQVIDVCSSSVRSTKYYRANAAAADVGFADGKVDMRRYNAMSDAERRMVHDAEEVATTMEATARTHYDPDPTGYWDYAGGRLAYEHDKRQLAQLCKDVAVVVHLIVRLDKGL